MLTVCAATVGNPSVPLAGSAYLGGILSDSSTRELRDEGSSFLFEKTAFVEAKSIHNSGSR